MEGRLGAAGRAHCQPPGAGLGLRPVASTTPRVHAPRDCDTIACAMPRRLSDGNKGAIHVIRCSSATTLIMKWLEFGGQELSKRPDMIGQSSGHSRCSVAPLGLDQSRG